MGIEIWAGLIPLGMNRGTSFSQRDLRLARGLIETASSQHGETATGCGSIAALGSYPTKEDRSRSDVRHSREARDLRRDRNPSWRQDRFQTGRLTFRNLECRGPRQYEEPQNRLGITKLYMG